jgi:hypothetical protein
MLPPAANALVQGINQGNQQAQQILPNAFQPRGGQEIKSPYDGSFMWLVDSLNEYGSAISKNGDKYRALAQDLYKASSIVEKVRNKLNDLAAGNTNEAGSVSGSND